MIEHDGVIIRTLNRSGLNSFETRCFLFAIVWFDHVLTQA